MDFNTTIDIIIKDLGEARKIIDDLKNYPGVPRIQIELAKSKCRSAEEIIALLKTMKQDFQEGNSEGVEGVEGVERVERIERETEKVKPPVIETEEGEAEKAVMIKTKEKQAEGNIVADQFSGKSNTFNEQIGNTRSDGNFSTSIKSRPLENLSEAIGINDKFLFIREIFSGDNLSYNEAILKLNKADNLSDAKAVIMSYTGEGDENEAVKQLLELVKRKLPADE